jgi:hypothetical protein
MEGFLTWALENGPGFAFAEVLFWLSNKERDGRDADRIARQPRSTLT